jgi:predicted DCC family thiol-disulfide oxidoreductase YuxK
MQANKRDDDGCSAATSCALIVPGDTPCWLQQALPQAPTASGNHVTDSAPPEVLTVLYDGGCPLCRREIAHVQRLAEKRPDSALCFIDVCAPDKGMAPQEQAKLLARFHVQRADGQRLDGAAAFVAMWARLPGWRWLARMARLPGALPALEWAYVAFLRVRPRLQALARRMEQAQ